MRTGSASSTATSSRRTSCSAMAGAPPRSSISASPGSARSDRGRAELTAVRTQFGQVLGTPRYMSPEQAFGLELDHRSDLFSLGVVLYELITGQTAFAGTSIATLALQITQRKPEPLDKVRAGMPARAAAYRRQAARQAARQALRQRRRGRAGAASANMQALSAAEGRPPPAAAAAAPDPGDGRGGRARLAAQHRDRAQPPVSGDGADGADLGHRDHQLRRQQCRAARGRECRASRRPSRTGCRCRRSSPRPRGIPAFARS